jgi:hypothetical protein
VFGSSRFLIREQLLYLPQSGADQYSSDGGLDHDRELAEQYQAWLAQKIAA